MTVSIRHLSFGYRDQPVLRQITAEARPGRLTAVLGPNAVGKSTLLRCVIGVLRPEAGAVLIDGRRAHELRGRALAARIAYVAQRPRVSAAFSVREVVELGRYAMGADPRRIDEVLARCELEHIANRPHPSLSVGQQQRVALARALVQLEPGGHLVLDEPTAAMDLYHARQCFGLLREMADEEVTVVMAMHDLSAAAAHADDVWLIAGGGDGAPGRLAAAGPVADVMTTERLEAVFDVAFQWVDLADDRRILIADTGGKGRIPPT